MNQPESTGSIRPFGFLLLPGFSNLCLANAVEPLRAVNGITGRVHYRHHLLSLDGGPVRTSSGIEIGVDSGLRDAPSLAAFFVIAGSGYRAFDNAGLRRDLYRIGRRADIVGGLDTGPWLLAAAELLDGHRATIHWQELDRLRQAFGDVTVTGARYVIDRNRITAGGATAVLDLMLALIRQQISDVAALDVMRLFLYDRERAAEGGQQGPLPAPFTTRVPIVAAAIAAMDETVANPAAVADIARRVNCSQRKLERAFRQALGVTPQYYYRYLRLSAARQLLVESGLSVTEAAVSTGFTSATGFARAYRQLFGHAPRHARTRSHTAASGE